MNKAQYPKAAAAALAVIVQHDVPLVHAQKAAKPGAAVHDCRALTRIPVGVIMDNR